MPKITDIRASYTISDFFRKHLSNVQLLGVDIVHDLTYFPYPFDECCVNKVYLNNVLEHFALTDNVQILAEIYRILKPEGIVHIRVPHVFSVSAWTDPTHKSFFTFDSARFFDEKSVKSYYQETDNLWEVLKISAMVTCFNWKKDRMRQIDNFLGRFIAGFLNILLLQPNFPGNADLLVKMLPLFYVEIRWELRKSLVSKILSNNICVKGKLKRI